MSKRERKESTAGPFLGTAYVMNSPSHLKRHSVFHARANTISVEYAVQQRKKILVDQGKRQSIIRASEAFDVDSFPEDSTGSGSTSYTNSTFSPNSPASSLSTVGGDDSDSDESVIDAISSPSSAKHGHSHHVAHGKHTKSHSLVLVQGSNVLSNETDLIKDFTDAYGGDMDTDGPGFQAPPMLPPPLVMEYEPDTVHEVDPVMMWDRDYSFENEDVFKTGWLVKEGRIHKNWKKRWFVLQGSKLHYFTAKNKKLKGTLDLETCLVKIANREKDGKDKDRDPKDKDKDRDAEKLLLQLVTEDRRLFFFAETNQETQAWYMAIQNKIAAIQYVKKSKHLKIPPHVRISAFLNAPKATHLNFSEEPIRMEAVVALSQMLANHLTIHTIEITNACMDSLCFSILCKALHQARTLKVLDVSHNNITDVSELGQMLASHKTLQCLSIHHNPIGDSGVSLLVETIAAHDLSLEVCSFVSTQTSDEGAIAIAKHMPNCKRITVLALKGNKIGATGAAAIGRMLFEGKSALTAVDLSHNNLGNDGCVAFCEHGLGQTRILDLSYNDIGYSGAHALCKVLPGIRTLMFGGNRISEQIVRDILLGDQEARWSFPDVELVL
eukprot:ANDGO_06181.mRNA.1 hypothetical protein